MYRRIQKSPSDNSPTQLKSSQLAQRSTIQTKQNSPKSLSRSENEKEVNRQNRSEVSRLGHNIANIPISSPHKQGSAIQTKLTIGDPGSKNERRADSIAAKVEKQIKSPQFKQQMQFEPNPKQILVKYPLPIKFVDLLKLQHLDWDDKLLPAAVGN